LCFEASPGKQFTRPYLKNTQHRKELVEWLKVEDEFKPQYCKNKQTKLNKKAVLAL
jgi:hypothetical protein